MTRQEVADAVLDVVAWHAGEDPRNLAGRRLVRVAVRTAAADALIAAGWSRISAMVHCRISKSAIIAPSVALARALEPLEVVARWAACVAVLMAKADLGAEARKRRAIFDAFVRAESLTADVSVDLIVGMGRAGVPASKRRAATVARRVIARRLAGEPGMTQRQIADLFGTDPITVYRWIAGRTPGAQRTAPPATIGACMML